VFALALGGWSAGGAAGRPTLPSEARPNVLVIVADDLGYSDIGTYGGEIRTPNLDRLARTGTRLTHFHGAPSCSPSRSMMLSGADNHVAGVGAMAEYIPPHYRGHEGFEGELSTRVASLAERFAAAGYRTAMSGKWHLGMADGQRPAQRGFQTSFALLQGAANHFGDGGFGTRDGSLGGATYVENDRKYEPQDGFYSSDVYADKLIAQISGGDQAKPFFAYLAFSAPHSPLQAPAADIERYAKTYSAGWARLAQDRLGRMRRAGVLPGAVPSSPAALGPSQESWDALTPDQKFRAAREMAVYAAMISRMDHDIGRVLTLLKRSSLIDNTIILFMSDNGPAGEDPRQYAVMPGFAERYRDADKSLEAMGTSRSFLLQDPRWASAIAAPSRLFKGFVTEGGTLVPLVVCAPGVRGGSVNGVVGDMRDIAPTLLALANIPPADTVNGLKVAPIEGVNLMPFLKSGKDDPTAEQVAFGFNGQGSVRAGPWKAMRILPPMGDGTWHLYNTHDDPAETQDRKGDRPELFAAMMASWSDYVTRHRLDEAADLGLRVHTSTTTPTGY
jgi:arylsulfatase